MASLCKWIQRAYPLTNGREGIRNKVSNRDLHKKRWIVGGHTTHWAVLSVHQREKDAVPLTIANYGWWLEMGCKYVAVVSFVGSLYIVVQSFVDWHYVCVPLSHLCVLPEWSKRSDECGINYEQNPWKMLIVGALTPGLEQRQVFGLHTTKWQARTRAVHLAGRSHLGGP